MVEKIIRTACPRDCRDTCTLLVKVKDGRVIDITGDPENELTRGFVCSKARGELNRLYSPDRLIYPRIKEKSGWREICWEEALNLIAEKIKMYCEKYSPLSILYYSSGGNMGWLHELDQRFFNLLGGVTTVEGSLCSAAGEAAQKLDFGSVIAHDPLDILNAKNVIIWGRNPAYTNIHLLPLLKQISQKGSYITLIDPVPTKTANYCNQHLGLRPGTDGAFALGMAKIILDKGLYDKDFIKKNVKGFKEFKASLAIISISEIEEISGIRKEEIESLAVKYATEKPGAILLGFGVQRYQNSGTTIRAIDALGAITGNIGVPGGGINYKCDYNQSIKPDITGKEKAKYKRKFPRPAVAQYILEADNPEIKSIFVAKANPGAQLPNYSLVKKAINSIDFKVVIDLEMTETAQMADIVLPATTFFEQENIYSSWGHNYIIYGKQAIKPRGGAKNDWDIFRELAYRLGFGKAYGDTQNWIKTLLQPYLKGNENWQDLKGHSVRSNDAPYVSWQDGNFKTPSKKFELYSAKAIKSGISALPVFKEPAKSNSNNKLAKKYPFNLISPAHTKSIHSQFFENVEPGEYPLVHLGSGIAKARNIQKGSKVNIITERGELTARVKIHSDFRDDVVLVYNGGSPGNNKGINVLTPDQISDIGISATFYDCLCDIQLK